MWKLFFVWNGRLRHEEKICVPESLAATVFHEVHHQGHGGIAKTIEIVSRRYTFPCCVDVKTLIGEHVKGCGVCQAAKPRVGVQPSACKFHPIPSHIFSSICVDFLSLPQSVHKGELFDTVLVIVDRTSGYVVTHPLRKFDFAGQDLGRVFF